MSPWLSACFAAPTELSNVTADPGRPESRMWWERKTAELWQQWPEFGGLLVKADSEGACPV